MIITKRENLMVGLYIYLFQCQFFVGCVFLTNLKGHMVEGTENIIPKGTINTTLFIMRRRKTENRRH